MQEDFRDGNKLLSSFQPIADPQENAGHHAEVASPIDYLNQEKPDTRLVTSTNTCSYITPCFTVQLHLYNRYQMRSDDDPQTLKSD